MVCAAVGYVVALGGTSAGQGWQLVPHLALAHAGPPPPALVVQPTYDVVLPTLRTDETHAHGGHTHSAESHPYAAHSPHLDTEADAPGAHRHGDLVHDHRPPPPRREAPVVALDKHHLPLVTTAPAPLVARVVVLRVDETEASHSLPVETPPPVGRG